MTFEGRWVPLPDGEMPKEGQQVRVGMESQVRCVTDDAFVVGEPGPANRVFPDAHHVRSVEVWEPAENLIPGEWYRDANGCVAQYRPDRLPPWTWNGTGNHPRFISDAAMVRPLSIARWEPVQ